MSEQIRWAEMTPIQRNALVAEKVMGWQWIPFVFYDCSVKGQLWLLPDGQSVADLRPGEWTWYLEEETIFPEGSLFPLPHKDNRILPANWIPDYTTSMDAAWQVVEKFKQDGRGGYEFIQWQYHLGKLYNRPSYRDTLYDLNPEGVCIAGLRAVGVEIEPTAEPS